jgi:hypothetical protein
MEMETEDDADGDADPPPSTVPLIQSPESQPDIAKVGPAENQELVASCS